MSAVSTPMLPQALDAEEALLGSVLIDPDAWLAARTLTQEDFYREAHAVIFATMRQLQEDGVPVDVITLTTRLERTGLLEKAGGSAYIGSLVNAVPTSQNAHTYAYLIKQASQGRQVVHLAGDLASIGYHSTDPASAAIRAVASLSPAQPSAPGPDLSPQEAQAHLETFAPTLQRLDALLAEDFAAPRWVVPDLLPEGLTLLAAKPKLGKSWLALGLALAVASGGVALGKAQVEAGDVLYLALEDSPKRLHLRGKQLLGSQPAPSRLEVATGWPRLDEGGLRLLEIWLQSRPGARLIILDTLAKIRGHTRSATLYGDDYASLEQVQQLAHAYEVAILVIHHTGKESREDPLDEVNATQGLNGVADNILVLRRERGKPQATLVGDGRELNGIELSLRFDAASGAWTLTEPPPADQPKTPERAEILDLLKASEEPLSPKQIAEALGKNASTISLLLRRMVREGAAEMAGYGKYVPAGSARSARSDRTGNASALEERKKKDTDTLFEKKEMRPPSPLQALQALQALPADVPESAVEADAILAALPNVPPADFLRFVHTVANAAHSHLDESSPRQQAEPPEQRRLDDFLAMAKPDAHDPYTLQPSGLRPASLARADDANLWPIAGAHAPNESAPAGTLGQPAPTPTAAGTCTGVFCEGECACGEHLCKECGCEAGALIDNRPWYYERHVPLRGAICAYCFAPATVMSRWKTPMCERCWMIASRGQGIDPRRYQPRPFGPMETDGDEEDGDLSE
jgi:DNA-binding CsgD family transcriptional regulator